MHSQLPNPPQAIVKTRPTTHTHTPAHNARLNKHALPNAVFAPLCPAKPRPLLYALHAMSRLKAAGSLCRRPNMRVCACDIFSSEVMSFKDGAPAASPLARVAANPLCQPQPLAASFLFFRGSG